MKNMKTCRESQIRLKRKVAPWLTQQTLGFIWTERSGGDGSVSGKYFPKSSTRVMDKGRPFSLTLILIQSPKIKKLLTLPKQCSFLLLDLNTLWYGKSCWQFFLLENLMMTVALFLLILWQASMWLEGVLQPNLSKIFTTFSSKTPASTSLWMSVMSIHSCLECWGLA